MLKRSSLFRVAMNNPDDSEDHADVWAAMGTVIVHDSAPPPAPRPAIMQVIKASDVGASEAIHGSDDDNDDDDDSTSDEDEDVKPCKAVEISDELSLEDLFGPLPADADKLSENAKVESSSGGLSPETKEASIERQFAEIDTELTADEAEIERNLPSVEESQRQLDDILERRKKIASISSKYTTPGCAPQFPTIPRSDTSAVPSLPNGNPKIPTGENDIPNARNDPYSWTQDDDEVHLVVQCPKGTTKRQVHFSATVTKVSLIIDSLEQPDVLDGVTFAPVVPDSCTYTIEDTVEGREVHVSLVKKEEGQRPWPRLLQARQTDVENAKEPLEVDVDQFTNVFDDKLCASSSEEPNATVPVSPKSASPINSSLARYAVQDHGGAFDLQDEVSRIRARDIAATRSEEAVWRQIAQEDSGNNRPKEVSLRTNEPKWVPSVGGAPRAQPKHAGSKAAPRNAPRQGPVVGPMLMGERLEDSDQDSLMQRLRMRLEGLSALPQPEMLQAHTQALFDSLPQTREEFAKARASQPTIINAAAAKVSQPHPAKATQPSPPKSPAKAKGSAAGGFYLDGTNGGANGTYPAKASPMLNGDGLTAPPKASPPALLEIGLQEPSSYAHPISPERYRAGLEREEEIRRENWFNFLAGDDMPVGSDALPPPEAFYGSPPRRN